MLVGHSAGAHLCTMALLELLHEQRLHTGPFPPNTTGMLFHESHYGRLSSARDTLGDSSGSSESFAVVSENGNDSQPGSLANSQQSQSLAASIVEVTQQDLMQQSAASLPPSVSTSMVQVTMQDVPQDQNITDSAIPNQQTDLNSENKDMSDKSDKETKQPTTKQIYAGKGDGRRQDGGDNNEDSCEEDDDNDSVVTVRPKEIERHATLIDLASSIKAFVGKLHGFSIEKHSFIL